MGIAERKAAKQFEETHYPKLKKDLDAAARFEVTVEVDWASLAAEGYEHLYEEAWPKVYFAPLIGALRAICQDDLGRESLQGSLRRVVIRNSAGNSSASSVARFQDGVLTLDHEPVTNVDEVEDRQQAIQQALESAPTPANVYAEDLLRAFTDSGAKGLDAVLHAALSMAGRQEAGIPLVLPRLTLSLRSGRAVSGFVKDILEDRREGRAVLLYQPRESDTPYDDAVIIPVGTIETVTVHDVPAFGALKRDAVPVPSLLQLKRQLAALEARVRAATETALVVGLAPGINAGSADELRALAFLAERTREVLDALVKDDVGRAALREKVKRIHLRTDRHPAVSLTEGTLELVNGRRPLDWYPRQELETAVQNAL
ncbi:hypothetical protein [Pyxidicoccus xibeiensis]|uniref:hypothetical protein n=1 Tax=Pyxidicoccus xibeiensis TaxID=2906759 RepID=UPI0020A75A36|nr:hypothetical protein [Pyxidicoccus xibeiensis]MCP3135950.1 hypothetical protein [Pyxidicoccus xibeiensis]